MHVRRSKGNRERTISRACWHFASISLMIVRSTGDQRQLAHKRGYEQGACCITVRNALEENEEQSTFTEWWTQNRRYFRFNFSTSITSIYRNHDEQSFYAKIEYLERKYQDKMFFFNLHEFILMTKNINTFRFNILLRRIKYGNERKWNIFMFVKISHVFEHSFQLLLIRILAK